MISDFLGKLPYPVNTLMRVFKYKDQGFRICSGGMNRLILEISKLELHKNYNDTEITEDRIEEMEQGMSSALFSGID